MAKTIDESGFVNRDLVSLNDYTEDEIKYILERAEKMIPYAKGEKFTDCMRGRVMATLFFEPSTRTKLSHETAMQRLGGSVIGFSGTEGTSVAKGETLADTVRMADAYSDIIVLRHKLEGAARMAAEFAEAPIINGGDGAGQHPTQTLLDLFTINKEMGRISGLKIAIVGDLKYGRTAHSLARTLARFKCNLYFVAPPILQMPGYIVEEIENVGIKVEKYEHIEDIISDVDVLYVTRIQKERIPDITEYKKVEKTYRIDIKLLEKAKDRMIVMHPLPRLKEISPEVDNTKYACYFTQAFYGVPVRMALITLLLGVKI